MKKFTKYLLLIIFAVSISACENSPFFNPFSSSTNSLNVVHIPNSFTWDLSSHVDLKIVMELEGQGLESIEGEMIYLLDSAQNILSRSIIQSQEAQLYYKIPASLGKMIVYFPTTGNYEYIYSWACLGTLNFNYAWENPDEENGLGYLELISSAGLGGAPMKSGRAVKSSAFANSDFSVNNLQETNSYNDNYENDNQWYVTTKNKAPASIENGVLVLGQQKNKKVEVFQTIAWNQGGEFDVKVSVKSADNKDVRVKLMLFFYTQDGSKLRQKSKSYKLDKVKEWEDIEVSEEVPSNTAFIKLIIYDEGKSKDQFYVDNITSTYNSDPDTDKDGILDKEDDFPDDPLRAFNDFFPSATSFGTLAFEDLWPSKGDYDFNDLVVDYRFNQVRNAENLVIEVLATIQLRAIGGSFHNGFGIEFPFSKELVSQISGQELKEGIVVLESNGTETGSEKATAIVFEDAWNYISVSGVSFVNTHSEADQADPYTFNVQVLFTRGLTNEEIGSPPYNPFIFINGDRTREVHLFGHSPTDLMDLQFLGTNDDFSNQGESGYFKTVSNLPWALDIPASFDYPEEKNPVNEAYLNFIEWAETAGTSRNDWYQEKDGYRDQQKIFKRK